MTGRGETRQGNTQTYLKSILSFKKNPKPTFNSFI